ncbi:hypothetical protein Q3G72_023535 [Acer saccharum]|nr:hypothetical protein Q3G72_023535 [Acer saccharum]
MEDIASSKWEGSLVEHGCDKDLVPGLLLFLQTIRMLTPSNEVIDAVSVSNVAWSPQCEGILIDLFLKMNTDVAIDTNTGRAAEAVAIYRGLMFAYDSGLLPCIVEYWSLMPRLANLAAYSLAKFSLSASSDHFWIEEYPPCVAY